MHGEKHTGQYKLQITQTNTVDQCLSFHFQPYAVWTIAMATELARMEYVFVILDMVVQPAKVSHLEEIACRISVTFVYIWLQNSKCDLYRSKTHASIVNQF